MAGDIHYEVYLQKNPKTGWSLVEALDDRAAALKLAEQLLGKDSGYAVRVTKETFNAESGDFLTITILEQGFAGGDKKKTDEEIELPCFQPQDLYSPHARQTIAHVLEGPLSRWRMTVSELLHRPDAVEQLETAGMELQHAIQKVAIAQAGERNQSVQAVVKKLNTLVAQAIEQIHADGKAGKFLDIGPDGLAGLAKKLKNKGQAEYRIRGAIALALKDCDAWADKLAKLLSLMQTLPADEGARDQCLVAIDAFIAEMLAGKTAIRDFIGDHADLGEAVGRLIDVLIGEAPDGAPDGIRVLAAEFAQDRLPSAHRALAARVLDELRRGDRLRPDDIEAEVRLVRKLAGRIVLAQGKYLSVEEISEAFSRRSKRLVTPEAIEEFLADCAEPDARIEKMFLLEENIVGQENRRRLAEYMIPMISGSKTETHFITLKEPAGRKLKRVADLQKRALTSGFHNTSKLELARELDALAVRIDDQTRFTAAIAGQKTSAAERVVGLLRLCVHGILTEGECAMRAKRLVTKLMRDPSFMESLVRGGSGTGDPTERLKEMKQLLAATGLTGAAAAASKSEAKAPAAPADKPGGP